MMNPPHRPPLWADPLLHFYLIMGLIYWVNTVIIFNLPWPTWATVLTAFTSWQFVLLMFAFPIIEEIIFRQQIQGYLLKTDWGKRKLSFLSYANLLSAGLFASLHVVLNVAAISSFFTILPGLAFGHVFEKRQHLSGAILLHCYYNAGFIIFLSR